MGRKSKYPTQPPDTPGGQLRRKIEETGITNDDLAKFIRVSDPTISNAMNRPPDEKGQSRTSGAIWIVLGQIFQTNFGMSWLDRYINSAPRIVPATAGHEIRDVDFDIGKYLALPQEYRSILADYLEVLYRRHTGNDGGDNQDPPNPPESDSGDGNDSPKDRQGFNSIKSIKKAKKRVKEPAT